MILTGLIRLGRDAELKYTPAGMAVTQIAGVYNYGKKVNGEQPGQWVELTLWGKQAEAVTKYLTKGSQIDVVSDNLHIETFTKKDQTTGVKLVGTVLKLDFAGGGQKQDAAPQTQHHEQKAQGYQPKPDNFDDDFDDAIPF